MSSECGPAAASGMGILVAVLPGEKISAFFSGYGKTAALGTRERAPRLAWKFLPRSQNGYGPTAAPARERRDPVLPGKEISTFFSAYGRMAALGTR